MRSLIVWPVAFELANVENTVHVLWRAACDVDCNTIACMLPQPARSLQIGCGKAENRPGHLKPLERPSTAVESLADATNPASTTASAAADARRTSAGLTSASEPIRHEWRSTLSKGPATGPGLPYVGAAGCVRSPRRVTSFSHECERHDARARIERTTV